MSERCPERTNVGVFMAGALAPEEHGRFAEHLAGCDECTAETAELAPVFAMLDHVTAVAPVFATGEIPAGLRDRVLAAVDRAGTDAVMQSIRGIEVTGSTEPHGAVLPMAITDPQHVVVAIRGPRRRIGRWLAAVAAAIALVSGGVLVARSSGGGDGVPQFALSTIKKGDPVTMAARVRSEPNGTVAELVVWNSKPNAIYGVWFESPDGTRISIGSFRGSATEVHFRGETAVLRDGIVAMGVWADGGDVTRADL